MNTNEQCRALFNMVLAMRQDAIISMSNVLPVWVEYLKLGISLLTLFSIVLAYLSYRANLKKVNDDRERDQDKELTLQFQKSLQWAYDVLTEEGKVIPPKANRLNWLTSARHLLRAQRLREQIKSVTYATVADEFEEYWRHKVYVALAFDELRKSSYFAATENTEWPENIEISSALVVVDFSNWKEGVSDLTDEVDRSYLMKHGAGLKGGYAGRGLEAYLCRFKEIKAAQGAAECERDSTA